MGEGIIESMSSMPVLRDSKRGFTIVELLIVIVVIAILAAISIVAYRGIQERARDSVIASSLASAYKSVKVAATDGELPTSLNSIISAPADMVMTYVPDQASNSFCISIAAKDGTIRKVDQTGVQIQNDACNVAEGATAISSNATSHANLPRVTDGIKTSSSYYGGAVGPAWVRVDLGSVQQIGMVRVWHYYADSRSYNNPRVEVSADGTNWETVYDGGSYPETSAGKTHVFTPRPVRYIRDHVNGSSSNTYSHWVEIQAG